MSHLPHGPSSSERRQRTAALVARLRTCGPQERDEVREELILVNQCVAESMAGRYSGRGVPAEDVRQVACEALVKAVRRFDPDAGKDLLSFAVPTIRGEVKRYFRDHGWVVRPPRRVQEVQQLIGPAVDELRQELAREPRGDEVARHLGVPYADYTAATAAYGAFAPLSLDQRDPERGRSLADLLPDASRPDEAAEARVILGPLVSGLTPRERRILHLRFCEDRTQEEIGAELGVTQTQVSRLLLQIVDRMRGCLSGEVAAG